MFLRFAGIDEAVVGEDAVAEADGAVSVGAGAGATGNGAMIGDGWLEADGVLLI